MESKFINKAVCIKWHDSYSTDYTWRELNDSYVAELCTVTSWGKVIYEDDKVIALTQNDVNETKEIMRQNCLTMVIPKSSIDEIITLLNILA